MFSVRSVCSNTYLCIIDAYILSLTYRQKETFLATGQIAKVTQKYEKTAIQF